MTTNLTESISKKLFLALITITIGVEIILYLSGYSLLASSIYDAIMVSSIFIGLKLHQRLSKGIQKTKVQFVRQFIGAFLFFILGSSIINIYSSFAFMDFSDDYEEYVQDYTDNVVFEGDSQESSEPAEKIGGFIDEIDTVGYDIYTDALAGLEEVWRLAYIILILLFFKKIFVRRWETGKRDIFVMIALFATSILFGIDHTLNTAQSWQYEIGAIVTFANMGLLFGLILLWTRSLWLTVLVHAIYDILATLSWYYVESIIEMTAFIMLPIYLLLVVIEKNQQMKKSKKIVGSEEIAN